MGCLFPRTLGSSGGQDRVKVETLEPGWQSLNSGSPASWPGVLRLVASPFRASVSSSVKWGAKVSASWGCCAQTAPSTE